MSITRRSLFTGIAAFTATAAFASCTGPQPASDGGVAWQDTVGRVLSWLRTELVSVRDGGYPAAVTGAAVAALSEVSAAESALTAIRGAALSGVCGALAPAIVAVVDATVGVLEALTVAGIPVSGALVIGVEAAGGVVSRLAGVVCPVGDAGVRAIWHRTGYTVGTAPAVADVLHSLGIAPLPVPAELVMPVVR